MSGLPEDPFTCMALQGAFWKHVSDQVFMQAFAYSSSMASLVRIKAVVLSLVYELCTTSPPIHPLIHKRFIGYLLRISCPSKPWSTNDGQSGWSSPFRTDLQPCLPLHYPCQPTTLPPSLPTVLQVLPPAGNTVPHQLLLTIQILF